MDVWHNADALGSVLELAKRCNKYIDETAPWVLAKSEESRPRLEAVLYNLLECIRMLGVMLLPFLPRSAEKILPSWGYPAISPPTMPWCSGRRRNYRGRARAFVCPYRRGQDTG